MFLKRKKKKTKTVSRPVVRTVADPHADILQQVRVATMTSDERIIALCDAINYLQENNIDGDIVECGVWKGGSMMSVALSLVKRNTVSRRLWLFDTFDGMSAPTPVDVDYLGNNASELMLQAERSVSDSIWCCASLEEVRNNLKLTGYPVELMEFVAGPVEETLLNSKLPDSIALLRLDTDWYESTKIELEALFPRLVTGGVLIVDDYGHWQGCREAVDEYFKANDVTIFLNRIDYTGRIGIKMPKGFAHGDASC